ncbi:hypothetical protein HMPREF9071_0899 [Capnocytophaga sp. oral taxon 338 str. F0234]|nr:hypothetical protein HMPREF9071_0899 [Capnocytophaga sp. oral taxon 338 str. F0234]
MYKKNVLPLQQITFKEKKMKKLLVLASIFLAISSASAQAALDRGGVQLNGGFGFTGWGIPVYVGADFGVTDQISVGGELFYRTDKVAGVRYNNFGVLANANYHLGELLRFPSPLDVYGGMSLGYYNWDNDYKGNRYWDYEYDSGLGVRLQTGARYFFTDNFGVNAEIFVEHNTGNTITSGGLKMGVTYQF